MTRSASSIAAFLLISSLGFGQARSPAVGTWQGKITAGIAQLRLVFHVNQLGAKLKATMDSPDQGAKGIPCGDPTFVDGELTIPIPLIKGQYKGKLSADGTKIEGKWSQGDRVLDLNLVLDDKVEEVVRPQTPKPPFPYSTEELTIANDKASVKLAGTLSMPAGKGPFPAVVLVSGSGPQDRDESLLGHKPFQVLADYLSRRGIAVLRYDDRGVGKSTGNFPASTTFDFADDAQAAVKALVGHQGIDAKKIGILGHSEGGLIAPIVAARDKNVGFIIMMAGPGVNGFEVITLQSGLAAKAAGATAVAAKKTSADTARLMKEIMAGGTDEEIKKRVHPIMLEVWNGLTAEEKKSVGDPAGFEASQLASVLTPWFKAFLTYDPQTNLRKVRVPVLALNGGSDVQVDASQNLPAVAKALRQAGNRRVTAKVLPGLNHLFQASKTGNPADYQKIDETLNPAFLTTVDEWLQREIVKK